MNHARAFFVNASTVVTALTLLLVVAVVSPAAAQGSGGQGPDISVRLFGLLSDEQFAAKTTFSASFGSSKGTFAGGGIEVLLPKGFFADLAVSRFSKTGQRAFISGGQAVGLGIPLTVTLTPVELTGGYRLRLKIPIVPYIGVGVGSYGYQEESSFDAPNESIDERKFGALGMIGAEVQLLTWLSASADVQDTRITGILGSGGISQQANENDLGGLAVRFRIIVGR